MSHPNASTALARVVLDELSVGGVEVVVVAPGSRSGALAIAALEHPDVDVRVVIDERSAAFHALGVARASGRPAVVLATSGTAPANFFPAIVEADMACVPLVAVSADRPTEMRGVGANQSIDQFQMFGTKVRAFVAIEAPTDDVDGNREWRGTIATAVAAAGGPKPGPVHVNIAFREPTVPVTDDGRTRGVVYSFETPRLAAPNRAQFEDDPMPVLAAQEGVVIAGDGSYDRRALIDRAAEIGWPILATSLSGLRGGPVISTYHHLLAGGIPVDLVPETVVAIGAIGPSTRLEGLIAVASRRVRIDRWGRHIDPNRNATDLLTGDPLNLLDAVEGNSGPEWGRRWSQAEADERSRLETLISVREQMSGAGVAWALNRVVWGSLVVASSLPIREIDAHLTRAGPVYANRGASGIDGFVSTALGVASVMPRTLALTGDLSLLHDSNGFLNDAAIDLTMVVIDNEGGGLFDSLPQARHAPGYERLFVTAPRRDLGGLAEFHGARYDVAKDTATLVGLADSALDRAGVDVISVPVDRHYDAAARAQLDM